MAKRGKQTNIVVANKIGIATLMLGTAVLASLLTLSAVIILQWDATALVNYSNMTAERHSVPAISISPTGEAK